MGINGIGGAKFGTGAPGDPTNVDPQREAQLRQMIENLESRMQEMQGNWDEYVDLGQNAEDRAQWMYDRMAGLKTMLEVFIETGTWPGVGALEDDALWSSLPDLEGGVWHGEGVQYLEGDLFDIYSTAVGDAEFGYDTGTLTDVIQMQGVIGNTNLDTLVGSAIGFAITDEEEIKQIIGKTVGNDIWITIQYKDDPDGLRTETYILEGLAVRSDVMIYLTAQQCTEKIIMDMSRVYRTSTTDGLFGSTDNGVILVGGKGDDILIGSQSHDTIVGNLGDDHLYGMGGNDWIFGDETQKRPGLRLESISTNNGGRDYIDGGTGFDTIYGGGGIDTAVKDSGQPTGQDAVFGDTEVTNEDNFTDHVETDAMSELESSINSKNYGWNAETNLNNGEIVVSKTGDLNLSNYDFDSNITNAIVLDIPEGYTMAYAENELDDIVITFTKMDDRTMPPTIYYLRVRLKDINADINGINQATEIVVNAPSIPTNGDSPYYREGVIYDFHECRIYGNFLKLRGTDQNDILIGARSILDEFRIKGENIEGNSTANDAQLGEWLDDNTRIDEGGRGAGTYWGCDADERRWTKADATGGEIVLTWDGNFSDLDNPFSLAFNTDGTFGHVDAAFYKIEDDGSIVVYAVQKRNDKGGFNLLKIKLTAESDEDRQRLKQAIYTIKVGEATAYQLGGVEFESDSGNDLIVGSIGSTLAWGEHGRDSNDSIADGWWEDSDGSSNSTEISDQDTDGDGLPDLYEDIAGTDPLKEEDYPSWHTPDDPEGGGTGGGEGGGTTP